MVNLQSLPIEVALQIIAYLPINDLLTLNLTSRYLRSCASANSLWSSLCHSLWPSYSAMHEVLSLPSHELSFSKISRGWMRAYAVVELSRKNCWLNNDNDVRGTSWLLYYKSMMPDGANGDAKEVARRLPPHAVFEWQSDNMVTPRSGAQFRPMRWTVLEKEKIIRISAYPSIFPARDVYTWLRVLETHAFLMVGESPEFLESIISLDETICDELHIPQSTALLEAYSNILTWREADKLKRVEDLYCILEEESSVEMTEEQIRENEERRRRETEKIHAGILAYCEQPKGGPSSPEQLLTPPDT